MPNPSQCPMCRRATIHRRGMSLYITVTSTALIVSLLGLTGLMTVRMDRSQASMTGDSRLARSHGRSAVELALRVLANDTDWRTTYINGDETTPQTLGPDSPGTVSWVLEDSDGNLTDSDTELRLHGVGRLGSVVHVRSIELNSGAAEVGPQQLRSMTSSSSQSEDDLLPDKLWCQYLKPSLPAEATGWRVTSVEIYCSRQNSNKTLAVRIFDPLPSNWPSSTVLDEVSVNSNSIGSSWHWHTFNLSGSYSLDPADGICVAVMTTASSAPIKLAYRSRGVFESDSALITGDPSWNSYETDKALRYRVHGVYTTAAGLQPIMGTWRSEDAPTP